MRTSEYLLITQKEIPAEAELTSHQLMIRAGMIRKLSSGLYTWLPLGLRVLRNIETIIREEMDSIGALEILMPTIQPAELWQESERWQKYGNELLKIQDRHQRKFCFGPTHEEVITDLARREVHSYKQLPINLYQIQTKFRDEIRPRFGVMRAREFLMKDAYSFHVDKLSLEQTYEKMYAAYSRIFSRLGLKFRAVLADTGSIGGSFSHEFQVLADAGEDLIAYSDSSDYAANIEHASAYFTFPHAPAPTAKLEKVATPNLHSIADVCQGIGVNVEQIVKTLVVVGQDTPLVALILRGDHELNLVKAARLKEIKSPVTFAQSEMIQSVLNCHPGSLGPIGLPKEIPIIVDYSAACLSDFTCGANDDGFHYRGANWQRDAQIQHTADLRNVVAGDRSPDGHGHLLLARGIEVGHIFQLGNKYSTALNFKVLNEEGKEIIPEMGCYGIGVSRIVAAAIEQNHDEKGIIWPITMAPFQIALIPIGLHKSQRLQSACEQLYKTLMNAGFTVLFDNRKERPGVLFADMDLLGIPYRLVISDRGLDNNTVEFKSRRSETPQLLKLDNIANILYEQLKYDRGNQQTQTISPNIVLS